MTINKPCGEIIESSLSSWLVQSWQWNYFIPFGSLVMIENNEITIFGVVHQVQTGSMDPARYPFPYQKTEQELLAEQPQIFEFLKTTFSCITVGYQSKQNLYYLLPPHPPAIHAFVRIAPTDICRRFFANDQFLHLLFNATIPTNIDELLLAIVNRLVSDTILNKNDLMPLMQTYSLLTNNDYRRMKLFLGRLQQVIG
jgi:hypothetical protein